jgi:hypothetical protein
MYTIDRSEYFNFENWVIENHPNEFAEWEVVCQMCFVELDEFISKNHKKIIKEWYDQKKYKG